MELPLFMGAGQLQIEGHRFQCELIEKGLGKISKILKCKPIEGNFTVPAFESHSDATRMHHKVG